MTSKYEEFLGPFSTQSRMDFKEFGKMWACAFCGPINCSEYILGRIATEREIDIIVGRAFRTGAALMANYKHDKFVRPKGQKQPIGWGEKANPEWHYLIEEWPEFVTMVEKIMRVTISRAMFKIAIMKTQYNTTHYCILVDDKILINPDPSLHGPIKKVLVMP